jgi:tetratricopeptide (TPR) repeat protein
MNVRTPSIVLLATLVVAPPMAQAQSAAAASSRPPADGAGEAYYRFVLGRHFESEGDIDRAIEAYRTAARLDPQSAEIPAELAGLYARQGRLEDAIAQARRALEIDGDNSEAHRVMGTLLASAVEDTGPATQRENKIAAAISHLERAQHRPGRLPDPSVSLTLARLHLRTENPAKAIEVLRRLVEDHPILEAWLLLGQAHTAAGEPEAAIRALEEGSTFDARLLVALAEMYEQRERWGDAAATYERASAADSSTADLRSRWAGALLNAPGEDSARRALELLESLLVDDPTDDRALYMAAQAHRRLGSLDQAEAAARRVIALQPDGLWGPYALALVFEQRREYSRVIETLAPVLAKWSPSRSAPARHGLTLLTHLGFAHLQLGRTDEAIATFERARSVADGDATYSVYLAQALVTARRYDEALNVLEPVRQKQPTDFRVTQIVIRALTGVGRNDEAVALLRSAVTNAPGEPTAYLALANLLSESKRGDEAHEVLDQAAHRFPKDPSVPFQRGALYERSGQLKQAEEAFRQVLALDPNHAPTLNYLGYMFAERGVRLDEAVNLIGRALTIDPNNGAYLDSLGWAYFQMKRFDQARDHLARAAQQMPGSSVVQDHFGDALAALGRHDEAIAAWTRALEGDRDSVEVAEIEGKIRRARSQAQR